MINKCPHCGFEPLNGQMVCPRCGEEIKENIAGKLATIKENNRENNDSVKWSDFKDVSIGSVMEESLNEATKEDDLADVNPILADYIKKHKDDYEETLPTAEDDKDQEKEASFPVPENDQIESQKSHTDLEETKNSVHDNLEPIAEIKTAESEVSEPIVDGEKLSNEGTAIKNDQETENMAETAAESSEKEQLENLPENDDSSTVNQIEPIAEKDEALDNSASPIGDQGEAVRPNQEEKIDNLSSTEQVSKSPRKKWPFVLLAAAIILGGSGYGYYVHDQNVKAQAQQEQQKIEKQETAIQTQLADFYTDNTHQFIKSDKTANQLADLTTQVNNLKEAAKSAGTKDNTEELTNEIKSIQEKMDIITQVNNLFETPVVKGSEIKTATAIKGSTIDIEPLTTDDEFSKTINNVISDAKSQLNDLNTAKKAVAVVYTDEKVKDNATRQQYQTAQKAVAKLVEGNQKKTLKANLEKVDDVLSKKEAAETKKQQEAQAAAAKKAANDNAQSESEQSNNLPAEASPNMQPNNNNAPIMAINPSAVADTNNTAWVWNAGIQEKVIQTCIDRGYIVAGGYYLEPVTIENGEGYYNLFATNTRSSLLKGISEKALPYYIVTINCKTGYFRGNGNDHTIR
ncbi:cell division site-positioning protein MapZ family protein [Enterococcus dispar]|uniref:cell division site-positioning protein MapZ family protein n=1 Tax=Enterococcus dispar TaxID=44009 RepID=UPI00288EFC79|nr:cell division site-positioning protein MapZ family protein [Enterococcus dispar]MDT2704650.1 cell division site-positioning protein MapZ family protein [Enterococcus dispar]